MLRKELLLDFDTDILTDIGKSVLHLMFFQKEMLRLISFGSKRCSHLSELKKL